jgi:hypothetical protein
MCFGMFALFASKRAFFFYFLRIFSLYHFGNKAKTKGREKKKQGK